VARIITKELAQKIVKKLDAVRLQSGGAHDIFGVWEGGFLIASFGMRRGSEKDMGHDHIPNDLHVGPNFAKGLAQCPKSRDDWLVVMRQKRLLPNLDG
jgi:hypothetical protein